MKREKYGKPWIPLAGWHSSSWMQCFIDIYVNLLNQIFKSENLQFLNGEDQDPWSSENQHLRIVVLFEVGLREEGILCPRDW